MSNFSELQTKIDSLEQKNRLLGIPSEFKIMAEEWNMIRAKLNQLKFILDNLTISGGSGITSISRVVRNFQTAGPITSFAAFINNGAQFTINPGQLVDFKFLRFPNGFQAPPEIYIFSLRGLQEGIFGAGGTRILQEQDLELKFERLITADEAEQEPSTQKITFPNLTTQNIAQWLTAQTPAVTLQDAEAGLVIFRGTINGQDASFLFVGPRNTYGVGAEQAEMAFFEPLQEAQTSETITVDDELFALSTNPVQNRVVTFALQQLQQQINDIETGGPSGGVTEQQVNDAIALALQDYYTATEIDTIITQLNQGIPDAPQDGNQYARKDGGWEQVQASSGGQQPITQAPQLVSGVVQVNLSNPMGIYSDATVTTTEQFEVISRAVVGGIHVFKVNLPTDPQISITGATPYEGTEFIENTNLLLVFERIATGNKYYFLEI